MATVGWRTACGLLLTCLALVAACATLSAALYASVQPVALDYGEPIVYGIALRVVTGEPLYQPLDRPPFTVAAYTPLYYWLAGGLQAVFGSGFGPGRVLSLAAGVITAVLIAVVAGRRNWGIGAFAGVLFLAFAFPGPDVPWLGLYRVDVLGVALSVAAITILDRSRRTSMLLVAGVLAGLALLCKQTLVAALIAGALFRPWKPSIPFVGAAVITFGVPSLMLQLTTGGAFLENTVAANANPFYLSEGARLLEEFARAQWFPLLLAAVYLCLARPWRAPESRLVVVYWVVSSLALVQLAKIGANHNYWIEFAAATAILAARGAACLIRLANPAVVAALLIALAAQLGGPSGLISWVRVVRSDIRASLTAPRDVDFDALVDRVRHEPSSVIAEPMDVVVLAGRQVVLEPFIFNILLDTGHWRADPVVDRICAGEVGLLVLAYPLDVGAGMTDGLHALWTPAIMAALADTMQLEGVQAQRYVYSRSASARGC